MTGQAARPPVTVAAHGIRRVLPLSAGMFVLGLDTYVLSGVLGNISGDLHVTVAAAGQMVTAFTLSYALLSPVLATVSGSWPRRRVLLGAMALFTTANVVSALAPTLAVLIVARVVAGAAAGLFAPTAGAMAGALVVPELRARALALSLGGLISATVIGVPVGTALGTHLGWRVTMFLVVALGAAAAALPDVPATAPPSLKARAATIAHRRVWPVLVLMLFLGIAALGLYTYLGTILTASTGVSPDTLPLYLMGWGLAGVAGNFGFARLIDSGRGPLPVLVFILVLLTAGLATLPLAGPAAVIGSLIGYGIGGGSAQVPLQHYLLGQAGDRAPIAISLLSGSLYLGSAIGTTLGAATLPAAGYRDLAYLAAIPAFLALAIAAVLASGAIRDGRSAAIPDGTAGALGTAPVTSAADP
jgi:predicted MFS family arabinose efflux permease